MDPTLSLIGLGVGLLLLIAGGDLLVARCAHLARSFNVPKTIVGAVVIGFGTSLPELFVSLTAALGGSPGIAIGNVVGSNIANVGLILGFGALVGSLHVQRNITRSDLPLGVLTALLLILWIGPTGEVSRFAGAILLGVFVLYLAMHVRETKKHQAGEEGEEPATWHPVKDSLGIVAGLVAILVGARLLVGGAVDIARLLDVDEEVIGLSIVAVGTSLPELAAIIAAVRHHETDLAVGNVAGSNLFNLLFVLGTTAVVTPIPVGAHMETDFLVLACFSVAAFPLLSRSRRIGRTQGLLMLVAYFAYIGWL
ncbi:MAG: calcium/sodium antiporter, partial [Planctomycetota bacterium]